MAVDTSVRLSLRGNKVVVEMNADGTVKMVKMVDKFGRNNLCRVGKLMLGAWLLIHFKSL